MVGLEPALSLPLCSGEGVEPALEGAGAGLRCPGACRALLMAPSRARRDRTCTILNVEGDAFGAGLLQAHMERSGQAVAEELVEVKADGLAPGKGEGSPLLRTDRPAPVDSCEESVM